VPIYVLDSLFQQPPTIQLDFPAHANTYALTNEQHEYIMLIIKIIIINVFVYRRNVVTSEALKMI